MPATFKDVRTSINRLNVLIEEINATLEERHRLTKVLKLTPSNDDNYELVSLIHKALKYMNYCQDDIIGLKTSQRDELVAQFQVIISRYEEIVEQVLEDSEIFVEAEEFTFRRKQLESASKQGPKSVRFKDDENDLEDQMYSELMGTKAFKPYRDDESERDPDADSFDNTTNQQLFAQHQQQILQQDENLDALHQSIHRQNEMGHSIHSELDDHLIILNDLENGVESAQLRLNTAANRLHDFRRKVRENGSLATIIVLTIILVVLLVVLN